MESYFKHWRDIVSYRRYDRWCEENYIRFQEEELCANLKPSNTKFVGSFYFY